MIKAIIFDLDGVLVDACQWHYLALNEALREHVGYEISIEDHKQSFNGLPTKIKLEMLNIPHQLRDKIWREKQDKTLSIISKHGSIDKYKIRMLEKLKNDGFMLACVTNSIMETAREMLSTTGLIDMFDLLVTNEHVSNNKPHPDCYLLAFEKLGISSNQAVIVEDSPKGIQAARSSGAKVIEVVDLYDVNYDFIKEIL